MPGEFTETGWRAPEEEIPYERWENALVILKAQERRTSRQLDSIRWWLADFLNYGEGTYGERHAQALDETDYSSGSLHNVARTGRGVPPEVRKPPGDLSFWKHTEVVGLDKPTQQTILDSAAEEDWKRDEIRDAAEAFRKSGRRVSGAEDFFDPASVVSIDAHKDTCPTCGGTGTVPKAPRGIVARGNAS